MILKIKQKYIIFTALFSAIFIFVSYRDFYYDAGIDQTGHYRYAKIERLKNDLKVELTQTKNRELLTALATGEKNFSFGFRQEMALTGTLHLVAISAFHTAIMMLILETLLNSLLLFLPLRSSWKRIVILYMKIFCSAYYFLITGASVPTLRAILFMLFFECALVWGRRPHLFSACAFSLTAVLLLIPGSLASLSFIMTALSVFTILRIYRLLPSSASVSLVVLSVVMNYALIPVISHLSARFPLAAPFVNFFVIPVISISVPFVSLAQISVIFSSSAASLFLKTADFLVAPAQFFIRRSAVTAELTAFPLADPPVFVKIVFTASFFCALCFTKKLKLTAVLINLISLLFFVVPPDFDQSPRRIEAFRGKAFCVKTSPAKGRIFLDRYRFSPDFDGRLQLKLEQAAAECGITFTQSLHLPAGMPERFERRLRRSLRFRNTKIFVIKRDFDLYDDD